MHKNHCRFVSVIFSVLCMITLGVSKSFSEDRGLSLVGTDGSSTITVTEGDPITIEVRIDDATDIAGASFTITYATGNLSLDNVESSFFGLFTDQISPPPNPGCVTVDSTQYCSPIVNNEISTGSMLAAARVDKGVGTNVTIFTLTFSLKQGGVVGTYPVGITQSLVSNASAGYAPNTPIPLLVGIDDSGGYPSYTVPSPSGCTVVINAAFVDTDNDGIDDNWEKANRPSEMDENDPDVLNVFSEKRDYDRDGYTDLQEYLNRDSLDPDGNPYDPKVKNACCGEGYKNREAVVLPSVLLLMGE